MSAELELDALEDEIMAEAAAEEAKPDRCGRLKKRQTGPDQALEDWSEMFVCLKGPRLYWQLSESAAVAGELVLTSDTVVLTGRKSLEIVSGNSTLLLLAATEAEAEGWKGAIEAAAAGSEAVVCDAKLVGR